MATLRDDYERVSPADALAICLGNFDGVHRGHHEIISRCLQEAKRRRLATLLFTFKPHPMKVLRPQSAPALLLNDDEKMEMLLGRGFDFILQQSFTKRFSEMKAEEFIEKVLIDRLKAKLVVVGANFRFGKGAAGNVDLLKKYSNQFETILPPICELDGQVISSSLIRDNIQKGNIEFANCALGYSYFISGTVVRGEQRGRDLGYPTANLAFTKECVPPYGIYVTSFQLKGEPQRYAAATSFGVNPSFANQGAKLEAHVLDFQGELYGREARLYFFQLLRAEKKFDSLEELRSAIAKDVEAVRAFTAQKIH